MRRLLLLVCLLTAACGSVEVSRTADDGPPERDTREGQEVQLDGAAGITAVRVSPKDPAVLLVDVAERRTGLSPECRRYSAVRVLSETPVQVEVAAYAYRPAWEVEPECPLVRGDTAVHAVTLRDPLGDRDVVDAPGSWPVFVQDRAVAGRSAVPGGPSCDSTSTIRPYGSVDYRHFLRHDGRMYEARLPNPGAVLVGEPLGTVRCMLSDSRTPLQYEPRDGDSGFVGAGTPYYAVQGRPVDEAIGAVWQGEPRVFEVAPD